MSSPIPSFRESNLFGAPLRKLGLAIAGTRLEPTIERFEQELHDLGIVRLKPRFYLSTEWGVPFNTIAIGIPFYLARPDLTALHNEEVGHIEGFSPADILRYLRHEMGHVVNYAYRLYDEEEWVKLFGAITQPYMEDYRPEPFSRQFVRHLPGWYAQKHPDEDWSETFAVWMTPGRRWPEAYSSWNAALAKLEYCDRTMQRLKATEPLVTAADLDADVNEIDFSLKQYYRDHFPADAWAFPGLDGALLAIFEDFESPSQTDAPPSRSAAELIRRHEHNWLAEVFRWTGHFPERTRTLVRHLAQRAEALQQVYPASAEQAAVTALTVFITSLAMNYVQRGAYFPDPRATADNGRQSNAF
jgi:hypothetical protein